METQIKYYRKNVYGRDLLHPANDQAARAASIANQKTLMPPTIALLKMMGFELVEVLENQSELS